MVLTNNHNFSNPIPGMNTQSLFGSMQSSMLSDVSLRPSFKSKPITNNHRYSNYIYLTTFSSKIKIRINFLDV